MRAFIAVYSVGLDGARGIEGVGGLEGKAIAFDASRVIEVVGAREWYPFPEGRDRVVGVMAWKGGAIGVLDVGALTGIGAPLGEVRSRPRVPIIRCSDPTQQLVAAVPAHAVREAVTVSDALITQEYVAPFCSELVELDGKRVPIFDVDGALLACRLRRTT